MLMNIYNTYEVGNQRLRIAYDEDAESPREWDNLGTMVCFHRQYKLGDSHTYANKDDFIFSLLEEAFGDTEVAEEFQDKELKRLRDIYPNKNIERELDEALLEKIEEKFLILPLYVYEHSGITISTGSFSCPWDSGQVGWVYVSHENILKTYGYLNIERATRCLEGEVKTFDTYLQGDVYGYILEKSNICDCCGNIEWEEVDSVWGYYDLASISSDVPDEFSVLI
jgi:hypothetical protein